MYMSFDPSVFVMSYTRFFSKVLANKLKFFLLAIITKHQSAYTKDWLISNNILVASKTLHCMKKHNSNNSGYMALKLDMNKAYNWVEWSFMEDLMRNMGFDENLIGPIMVCVKTIIYSILVNG